jgi:mRNA interferase HigB
LCVSTRKLSGSRFPLWLSCSLVLAEISSLYCRYFIVKYYSSRRIALLIVVKKSYANASILGVERLVFNIKGNDYRLVTAIDYGRKVVFIKWLGTHAAYDRIDARTVQYGD